MKKIRILVLLLMFLLITICVIYAASVVMNPPVSNTIIGPVITAGYPDYTISVNVSINVNVTLVNVTINNVEICSNNTANLSEYRCTWDVSQTAEGNYTVSVNATNSSGITINNQSTGVIVDRTNASIDLNFPASAANLSSTTVNFNWTAIDNLDLSLSCNLTIDSKINTTVESLNNSATNFSVSTLSESRHNWNVTCFDHALNSNTSVTRSFVIDQTQPGINLTFPTNGTSSTDVTFNFNWTVTDNLATQMLCNLTIDNAIRAANMESNNGSATSLAYSLNLGTHNWNVTCIDPSGNSNTSETFLLTITSPLPPGGSSGGGNSASRFYTGLLAPVINISAEETFITVYTYSSSRIRIDDNIYELRVSRILDDLVELRIGDYYFRADKDKITTFDLDGDNNDELSMKITDAFFNKVGMILKSLATVEETKDVVDIREDKEVEEYTSSETEKIQKAEEEIAPSIIPTEIKESKVSTIAMIIAILAIIAVFIFIYFKYSKPTKKKTLRF